ncbi:MAG TPA: hypothetical protein ENI26_00140 [Methylophaga aminisulfidivorans]|uniref:PilZ domain-containing protein n=1 Tax=Methylophaga aminisulfidivorans TaxID=230105 RepID=A0A7C1ZPS9_9GAMM|nr:hypothetical protein [Methylophaga aminisulfidivorans]
MAKRTLTLIGMSDSDTKSLLSILRLSSALLTNEWQISKKKNADLILYNLDSSTGRKAWQIGTQSMVGLLNPSAQDVESADVVIKKPLHKKHLADALNLIDSKLEEKKQSPITHKQTPQNSAKPRVNWLKKLFSHANPNSALPKLFFSDTSYPSSASETIKEPTLLQSWLGQLPTDSQQRVTPLLKNCQALLQHRMKPQQMLVLLEIYRTDINAIIFNRDIAAVKRDLYMNTESLRSIDKLNVLIGCLAKGYEQIIQTQYLQAKTTANSEMMLLCMNRMAELLGLQLLHCYQYYRTAHTGLWFTLHRFYLYQEHADTLNSAPLVKPFHTSQPYLHIYSQIILTALTDPYSQPRYDVIRLYKLMAQFTDKITISPVGDRQIHTNSSFLLLGNFCIDAESDSSPKMTAKTSLLTRSLPTTRLVNVQAALKAIKDLFDDRRHIHQTPFMSELNLLKRIIPQLDTTHERLFHRITSNEHRNASISLGLAAIHAHMEHTDSVSLSWQLANQSTGGLMAKRPSQSCYNLNIDDLVGIFEQDFAVKLAVVKWLHIDVNADIEIGLELIQGQAKAITCIPEDEGEPYQALHLTIDSPNASPLIITERGVFSPGRILTIQGLEKPLKVVSNGLVKNSFNHEIFNYTRKLVS